MMEEGKKVRGKIIFILCEQAALSQRKKGFRLSLTVTSSKVEAFCPPSCQQEKKLLRLVNEVGRYAAVQMIDDTFDLDDKKNYQKKGYVSTLLPYANPHHGNCTAPTMVFFSAKALFFPFKAHSFTSSYHSASSLFFKNFS